MTTLAIVFALGLFGQIPLPQPPGPSAKVAPAPLPPGPCATPKRALLTWLGNLQDSDFNLVRAAACVPAAAVGDSETGARLLRLKRVLDARGILVNVDGAPNRADYSDEVSGRPIYIFTRQIDAMYLEKEGAKWVISATTLARADVLYRDTFVLDLQGWVARLPKWMQAHFLGVSLWQVVALLLIALIGMVLRSLVARLLTNEVYRVMRRFKMDWGHGLIHSSALPLGTLALAGFVALCLPSLGLGVRFAQLLFMGVRIIAAVSVVHLAYRLVDVLSAYMGHRAGATATKLDDQLVPLVRRGLKIVVVVMGVLFVAQNLEINITSVVATFGLGSIAVALAAKDTVQNLFGSLTIFLDKPFHIGDWVQTCGVEGVVEEVGFRSTRVRTFYNSVVTIPNGKFTDAVVDNFGLRKYRRTSTTLELTYDTTPLQMEAFCAGVRGLLQAHPKTRKDTYEVHFTGYGSSGLEVILYFFCNVPSWSDELRARHEIYLDIWRLAADLGVEFAFPTTTVHLQQEERKTERPSESDFPRIIRAYGPGGENTVPPGPRTQPTYFAGEAAADQ